LSIFENTTAVINGDKVIGGNATERAVVGFAAGKGQGIGIEKLASIPFNSDNKYSASTIKQGNTTVTLVKGAPEKILKKCQYFFDKDGKKVPVEGNWIVEQKMNELASRAIRVLALAVADEQIEDEKLPEGKWTLVGILGIRDEVRPESVTAIKEVQGAGVQVVMITGDRKDTAVAIATEAGLLNCEDAVVLTSDELAVMSDEEIKKVLPKSELLQEHCRQISQGLYVLHRSLTLLQA
jgi:P-type E1-E2 ATPase